MADRYLDEVSFANFFTSIDGDRPYSAKDFVAYLGSTVGNGIIDKNDLAVDSGFSTAPLAASSITNYTVTINAGTALLGGEYGYLARQTDPVEIAFTADSSQDRWDRVVLILDNTTAERTIRFGVIEGTPGDAQPTGTTGLTQSDVSAGGVYELLLFDILIPYSGTSIPEGNIYYTYTPYVQFESKTNKLSSVGASTTPSAEYPNMTALINYALPLAGGVMTGDITLTNGSLYNVSSINSTSSSPISIVTSGISGRINLYADNNEGIVVRELYTQVTNDLRTEGGIQAEEGSGGYSIWSKSDFILDGNFSFSGHMDSDLNLNGNQITNAETIFGDLGTRPTLLYDAGSSPASILIDTVTNDSDGYTFSADLIPTTARSLKISFGMNSRNTSYPFGTPGGVQVAEISMYGLVTGGSDSEVCDFLAFFRASDEDLLAYGAKIQQLSSGGIKIFDPRYANSDFNTGEQAIYIHRIEVVY